jgi:hypothetical protein
MRSLVLSALAAACLAAPALAEPAIKAEMPAIRATLSGGDLVVRLDQGVTGKVNSLSPRHLVVVAKDASGRVIEEQVVAVPRRMTYARVPADAAFAGASTVSVTVR